MIMFLVWAAALLSGGVASFFVAQSLPMPLSFLVIAPYSALTGIGIAAVRDMLQ